MGFGPIRDLIAHAGAELKAAPIAELGLERACETEENVSLLAPMVGVVARRVFNHANANRTEGPGPPASRAGLAGVLSRGDRSPISGAKREIANLHRPRSDGSRWLDVA